MYATWYTQTDRHTHTHTDRHTYIHGLSLSLCSLSPSLSPSLSLILFISPSLSLFLSLSIYLSLSHTLIFSLSHSHTKCSALLGSDPWGMGDYTRDYGGYSGSSGERSTVAEWLERAVPVRKYETIISIVIYLFILLIFCRSSIIIFFS